MKLSQPALSLLEETIKQAIGKYACGCEQTVVTDIHLQANQSSGEFSIFDDDDKELASTTIEEWMTYEGDDFYENMERILSNLLCNLKNRGAFDKLHHQCQNDTATICRRASGTENEHRTYRPADQRQ